MPPHQTDTAVVEKALRQSDPGTLNAISGVIDWKFAPKWDVYIGLMRSQFNGGLSNSFFQNKQRRYDGGIALQVLKSRGRDDLRRCRPRESGDR